jgi:hypothetical protein
MANVETETFRSVAELLAETDARGEVKREERRRLAERFPARHNRKSRVAIPAFPPTPLRN